MRKLTLQSRITSLMLLSCILFISAFVFIQINSQIANLTIFNSLSAKLSGSIVKNELSQTLKQFTDKDNATIENELEKTIVNLVVHDIIADGSIIDKSNNRIISSSKEELLNQEASWRDLQVMEQALQENEDKWFEADIDKQRRELYLYIPIKNGKNTYFAKVEFSLGNIKEALSAVYQPAILASITIILSICLLGILLSKTVIGPIKVLNNATKEIASGKLESHVIINTNDELQELAETFNEMSQELIKMQRRAEDANPLTKLPGNIVIREGVEERIKSDRKFVVIHTDLNNFKSFNDAYGLAQGDEAIKLCAEVLKEAVKVYGNEDDIVGHSGGDDFVIVTTPHKAQNIADHIINEFDKRILNYYAVNDKQRGYIIAHSRKGETQEFPIMAISLSGVSNENRTILSFSEVTNIDAEVKQIVKSKDKSAFLMDRRNG